MKGVLHSTANTKPLSPFGLLAYQLSQIGRAVCGQATRPKGGTLPSCASLGSSSFTVEQTCIIICVVFPVVPVSLVWSWRSACFCVTYVYIYRERESEREHYIVYTPSLLRQEILLDSFSCNVASQLTCGNVLCRHASRGYSLLAKALFIRAKSCAGTNQQMP